MRVDEYLYEVKLGEDPEIESIFNEALKEVFSKNYLDKIEKIIYNKIKLREVRLKNEDEVAWVSGPGVITINKNAFDKRTHIQKIKYLLHEFIHVLQVSKSFFFFKKFKELHELANKLDKIVRLGLVKPYQVFLTGRNVSLGNAGRYEVISYLMNDSIDWSAIKEDSKDQFIYALKTSGLFNIESSFWRKRLK
jgi:hypothetical protein